MKKQMYGARLLVSIVTVSILSSCTDVSPSPTYSDPAANYFIDVKLMADIINPSMQDDFKDIHAKARKQGMEYMNQTVKDVLEFLEGEEEIAQTVAKIKENWFDDDDLFGSRE